MILFLALGFLVLTVFAGFAYDTQGQVGRSTIKHTRAGEGSLAPLVGRYQVIDH